MKAIIFNSEMSAYLKVHCVLFRVWSIFGWGGPFAYISAWHRADQPMVQEA